MRTPRTKSKKPSFQAQPFRVRAVTLALWAFVMGIVALVFALDDRGPRQLPRIPLPSASEPAWPEGFVEWDELSNVPVSEAPGHSAGFAPHGAETSKPAGSAPAPSSASAVPPTPQSGNPHW